MGRLLIEVMQVLADRIHQGGYTQRALEDDIYAEKQKRIAAEKDRDHWMAARKDAIAAGELMQAEIETLKGAMAADDKRLRDAEERVWPGETRGCDAPDAMADEILHKRQQRDAAWAENRELRRRLNEETDRHRATNAEKIEHWDRLQAANKNAAELVQKLDAAHQTILMQRQGIERLRAFVDKVRSVIDNDCDGLEIDEMIKALAELDAGTSEAEGGK